jgi:hypothetical protein
MSAVRLPRQRHPLARPFAEASGVRASRNGTQHDLRGGAFALLLPREDAEELERLRG